MNFKWNRNDERSFFQTVRHLRFRSDFDRRERDYKLQLASELRDARKAVLHNSRNWRRTLVRALRAPENNIINWRELDRLASLISRSSEHLHQALVKLWSSSEPVAHRIDRLASVLNEGGISQRGSQLTTGSTLLMALNAKACPPIRTQPFVSALARTGVATFDKHFTPGQRYVYAIQFLDALIRAAKKEGIELRDRLDAQSIVWWGFTIGWEAGDSDDDEPEANDGQFDELLESPGVTETQRQALIEARRGQDRFRESVLELWGVCAVTRCRAPQLLRASHLKPWKASSNAERLDPFNGLLLVPNLDCALDRGLISFRNNGRIMLSSRLAGKDRAALGLSSAIRLRRPLHAKHRRFLRYHRDHVFWP